MKYIKPFAITLAYLAALLSAVPASAGPYTDDLGKCLVSATSKEDRNALVRWMFAAASAHPAVSNLVKVSPAQIDEENKATARLFMSLLTESCKAKTQDALKFEGASAIEASFNLLGQVAGRELFSDPKVGANIAGLTKYLDPKKLQQLAPTAK
jgi:hypothetical protein